MTGFIKLLRHHSLFSVFFFWGDNSYKVQQFFNNLVKFSYKIAEMLWLLWKFKCTTLLNFSISSWANYTFYIFFLKIHILPWFSCGYSLFSLFYFNFNILPPFFFFETTLLTSFYNFLGWNLGSFVFRCSCLLIKKYVNILNSFTFQLAVFWLTWSHLQWWCGWIQDIWHGSDETEAVC